MSKVKVFATQEGQPWLIAQIPMLFKWIKNNLSTCILTPCKQNHNHLLWITFEDGPIENEKLSTETATLTYTHTETHTHTHTQNH